MRRLALLALLAALALAGCGGEKPTPKPAAAPPTPTPTVTPDGWAIKMCDYLAKQDPQNDAFASTFAATYAGMSTLPEVVDLGVKAKQVGSTNVLRGWCVRNYPAAGVKISEPKP